MPALRVHKSAAGYYIGSWCHSGPYSRESGYYPTAGRRPSRVFQRGCYGR